MRKTPIVGAFYLSVMFIVGFVSGANAQPAAIKAFQKDWTNRGVVLKQTLYTVLYSAPRIASATLDTYSQGITVASRHKGTYYYAEPRGTDMGRAQLADSSPERLVEKISAFTENQRVRGLSGRTQNVTAAPARLLTYEAGTRLTLTEVVFTSRWIRFDLHDQFSDRRGPATTYLLVEWEKNFSRQFDERSDVESLLEEFFDRAESEH